MKRSRPPCVERSPNRCSGSVDRPLTALLERSHQERRRGGSLPAPVNPGSFIEP
jgi:hypothetical protein